MLRFIIQYFLTGVVLLLSCFEEKGDGIKNWPQGMMR